MHGDHGSRISARQPSAIQAAALDASDLSDSFSTLFALRRPDVPAGYDRRMLPIDGLLEAAMKPGSVPRDPDWLQPSRVVLVGGAAKREVALPPFARSDLGFAAD